AAPRHGWSALRSAGQPSLQALSQCRLALLRPHLAWLRTGLMRSIRHFTSRGRSSIDFLLLRTSDVGQEPGRITRCKSARGVSNIVEKRVQPFVISLREIVEHVGDDRLLGAGMPDADPDADEIIADVSTDGPQAVVAGISPASFHPDLAWRQIQLVVKDDDVGEVHLEKPRCLAHGTAA